MPRIGDKPPANLPLWPWGGPRSVRERLVDPAQFDRKRRKKSGDPKRPALASAALLDFIGPGHSSDELRLPPPPSPYPDGGQELNAFPDRALTREVCAQGARVGRDDLEMALGRLALPAERRARLEAMLNREEQMLEVLGRLQADTEEIIERMKMEYKTNGSY